MTLRAQMLCLHSFLHPVLSNLLPRIRIDEIVVAMICAKMLGLGLQL